VYSLASVLALILLFVEWQPMPGGIWTVSHPVLRGVLYGIFGLGWSLMLLATYLIDHYELFGIRQVIVYFQGKELFPQRFKTPLLYQYVRHPLMLGFLLAFWATPDMTEGHLLFSLGMSAYILIGIHYEEKDLTRNFGRLYRQYRCLVPKLIPSLLSYRHKRQNFIRTREPD
jgi:methanethiol S-methyltransferase